MTVLKINELQIEEIIEELGDEESSAISGGWVVTAYGYIARAVYWGAKNGGTFYGDSTGNGSLDAVAGGNMGA
ncbi:MULTISPECIES: hypothetical protein [Nostocales]|uniref:Bacteriocin n=3 Tax=Nostocales TaxID=1161 RepID=A0A0C1NIG9_9CYAN